MKNLLYKIRKLRLLLLPLVFISVSLVYQSCTDKPSNSSEPTVQDQTQQNIRLSKDNPFIKRIMSVQDDRTPGWMKHPNVVGTATGLTDDGQPAILIFLKEAERPGVASAFPLKVDNIPVSLLVTGEFKALSSSSVSHTAIQTPPISLGTSGGWRYDLANGYCCGGTLGSLVTNGSTQYILSNYHVLYADIVAGGNNRVATPGDPVIQPGLIDVSCNASNAQNVGSLVSGGGSLPSANVDCGIAQVVSGMVRADGAILEVGTISSNTVAAYINQYVKKSGRTTGLTRSRISGLNATISITYENECAGGTAFTKTFTGQIIITNRRSRFLNSGDSGSLMVEDVSTNPRAVGLLYAGSSTLAVANPINDVLSFYGSNFQMVGQ